MKPEFHDIEVIAFLPAESTLLRLKKRELLDWLYCACRNWEMERDDHIAYAKHMTAKLWRAEHPNEVMFDENEKESQNEREQES